MACIQGPDGPQVRHQRAISSCERVFCTDCKLTKIEHAFPRGQLKAFDGTGKRLCLKCCASRVTLKCSRCNSTKLAEDFEPPMLTMPDDIITCRACQEQAKGVTDMRLRQGWITCRKCRAILPLDQCSEGRRQQFCPNCTTGCKKELNVQTCRNKACGKRWTEKQEQDARNRYCPECRSRR